MTTRLLTLPALVAVGSFCFLAAGEPSIAPPPRPQQLTLRLERGESVVALCFSADNRKLYAAIRDKERDTSRVYVWDLATGDRRYFAGHGSRGDILNLSWSDRDGRVVVWQREQITWRDSASGAIRTEVRVDRGLRYEGWNATEDDLTGFAHRRGNYSGRLVPTGDSVLVAGPNPTGGLSLRLVPFTDPKTPIRDFPLPKTAEVPALDDESFTLSPDGTALAACSCGADAESLSGVWVWDVRSGKRTHEFTYRTRDDAACHSHPLAVSRGGTFVVSGAVFGPIHVFDTRAGKATQLCEPEGRVRTLKCSPTADVFATGSGKAVELWSLGTGKQLAKWARRDIGEFASPVTFSPDGTRLAWGALGEGTIRVVPGVARRGSRVRDRRPSVGDRERCRCVGRTSGRHCAHESGRSGRCAEEVATIQCGAVVGHRETSCDGTCRECNPPRVQRQFRFPIAVREGRSRGHRAGAVLAGGGIPIQNSVTPSSTDSFCRTVPTHLGGRCGSQTRDRGHAARDGGHPFGR